MGLVPRNEPLGLPAARPNEAQLPHREEGATCHYFEIRYSMLGETNGVENLYEPSLTSLANIKSFREAEPSMTLPQQ
jgi:hypothetical protein